MVAATIYWFVPINNGFYLLGVAVGLFLIGVPCATIAENEWGHDDGKIVIDEVVGMLVALIAVPKTLPMLLVGFITFRFFDIVKLFPAHKAEHLPGGWGIMMDDVVAGVYANILTQVIRLFLWV